ncbi:MAG TPA: response regulator [Cytophaga sp.]|jgi:CheY-like chemotaxis protein|nr:response regulator [Cytophaga sp.]
MMYHSVLLVDDDDDSNFISELVIKKSSIADSITCVKNGNEALQFIINYKSSSANSESAGYDQIVFLDLHMPVMDGFDFLAQLAAQMPEYKDHIKIYILTSSSNPADIAKAKQYAIHGYINKPLDINKLKILKE